MEAGVHTVTGKVEFVWEDEDHVLVTIDPDAIGAPHTFELDGELRERVGELAEGERIEIDFVAVEHEIVDPDSGPSESERAEVRDLRVIG